MPRFILLFICFCSIGYSQVNAYAKVTSAVGATFNLSNVNETYDTFEDDELAIIIQMKDDVIGANTSNNASFGNLSSIQSAGKFHALRIVSHTESSGVPTSITFESAPPTSFNTGSNSRVQIVSFPKLGSPNYTTTSSISAIDWDGAVGGIVAFEVTGTLTLSHSISANGNGFRGGTSSSNYYSGCAPNTYYTSSSIYAAKGESIYHATNANYTYGRGKILNGGGGGNDVNAGGGGGSNYTIGGEGGHGWSCISNASGGTGGVALSGSITSDRIFMGGGGGGGQQNDSQGSVGVDGGGIVLIKASMIESSCVSSISISANGTDGPNSIADGAGGGGGGGTIFFQVDTWNISAGCPLTISANGGDGGDCAAGAGDPHGGGGGGGMGAVIFSGLEPTTNITTNTQPGTGGCNESSCASKAQDGGGSNKDGVIINQPNPLPVELLKFQLQKLNNNKIEIAWVTASEKNSDYFILERSYDNTNWSLLSYINSTGNGNSLTKYSSIDSPEKQTVYYKLKQVDLDGKVKTIGNESINLSPDSFNLSYTNINNQLTINYTNTPTLLELYSISGKLIFEQRINNNNHTTINNKIFQSGIYILRIGNKYNSQVMKIII